MCVCVCVCLCVCVCKCVCVCVRLLSLVIQPKLLHFCIKIPTIPDMAIGRPTGHMGPSGLLLCTFDLLSFVKRLLINYLAYTTNQICDIVFKSFLNSTEQEKEDLKLICTSKILLIKIAS